MIKRRLRRLEHEHPAIAEFLQRNVAELNGEAGKPRSFDRLDEILSQQSYRLSHWRTAADEINYRRFFDINGLAALCMEHKDVFEQTHQLAMEMLADGRLHGLRIDHIDGLFDPLLYLWDLQRAYVLALGRRHFRSLGGRVCDKRQASRAPEHASRESAGDESRRIEDVSWHELEPLFLASLARRLEFAAIGCERCDAGGRLGRFRE